MVILTFYMEATIFTMPITTAVKSGLSRYCSGISA